MYATRELAQEALIHAWVKNDYPSGRGPVSIYKCDDCGDYHLTSSGQMDAALQKYIDDGKLKLQKEADRWIDRLKKK